MSRQSISVGNLIADKGDEEGTDIQTGWRIGHVKHNIWVSFLFFLYLLLPYFPQHYDYTMTLLTCMIG